MQVYGISSSFGHTTNIFGGWAGPLSVLLACLSEQPAHQCTHPTPDVPLCQVASARPRAVPPPAPGDPRRGAASPPRPASRPWPGSPAGPARQAPGSQGASPLTEKGADFGRRLTTPPPPPHTNVGWGAALSVSPPVPAGPARPLLAAGPGPPPASRARRWPGHPADTAGPKGRPARAGRPGWRCASRATVAVYATNRPAPLPGPPDRPARAPAAGPACPACLAPPPGSGPTPSPISPRTPGRMSLAIPPRV
jgi:hypothetical protein